MLNTHFESNCTIAIANGHKQRLLKGQAAKKYRLLNKHTKLNDVTNVRFVGVKVQTAGIKAGTATIGYGAANGSFKKCYRHLNCLMPRFLGAGLNAGSLPNEIAVIGQYLTG